MDDKQLNPDQSMELIQQMIRQTRRRLTYKQGNLFLLWGYVLGLSALGIYALLQFTDCRAWQWLWLVPIITTAIITSRRFKRNAQPIRSYTDRLIEQIWGCIVTVSVVLFIDSALNNWSYSPLPLILIIVGTGLYITAQIVNNKYMNYSSILAVVFGLGMIRHQELYAFPDGNLILFATAIGISMIGSGYALNKQVKRDAAEVSENE